MKSKYPLKRRKKKSTWGIFSTHIDDPLRRARLLEIKKRGY